MFTRKGRKNDSDDTGALVPDAQEEESFDGSTDSIGETQFTKDSIPFSTTKQTTNQPTTNTNTTDNLDTSIHLNDSIASIDPDHSNALLSSESSDISDDATSSTERMLSWLQKRLVVDETTSSGKAPQGSGKTVQGGKEGKETGSGKSSKPSGLFARTSSLPLPVKVPLVGMGSANNNTNSAITFIDAELNPPSRGGSRDASPMRAPNIPAPTTMLSSVIADPSSPTSTGAQSSIRNVFMHARSTSSAASSSIDTPPTHTKRLSASAASTSAAMPPPASTTTTSSSAGSSFSAFFSRARSASAGQDQFSFSTLHDDEDPFASATLPSDADFDMSDAKEIGSGGDMEDAKEVGFGGDTISPKDARSGRIHHLPESPSVSQQQASRSSKSKPISVSLSAIDAGMNSPISTIEDAQPTYSSFPAPTTMDQRFRTIRTLFDSLPASPCPSHQDSLSSLLSALESLKHELLVASLPQSTPAAVAKAQAAVLTARRNHWTNLGGFELVLEMVQRFVTAQARSNGGAVFTSAAVASSPSTRELQAPVLELLAILWKHRLAQNEASVKTDASGSNSSTAAPLLPMPDHANLVHTVFTVLEFRRSGSGTSPSSSSRDPVSPKSGVSLAFTQELRLTHAAFDVLSAIIGKIHGPARDRLLALIVAVLKQHTSSGSSNNNSTPSKLSPSSSAQVASRQYLCIPLYKTLIALLLKLLQAPIGSAELALKRRDAFEKDVIPLVVQVMRQTGTSTSASGVGVGQTPVSPTIGGSVNAPSGASFLSVLICLFFSKTILLHIGVRQYVTEHGLVELVSSVMKANQRRGRSGGVGKSGTVSPTASTPSGGPVSPSSTSSSSAPVLNPILMSTGSHCLAFLLASQTPSLAAGRGPHLQLVQTQFLQHGVVDLILSLLSESLTLARSAIHPSGSTQPAHGGMVADLAFSLFIIFGSPGNIAKEGTNPHAAVAAISNKPVLDWPNFPSATAPPMATPVKDEISNSILTPAYLVANHPGSFEILVHLLCLHRKNSNVQICLSTLLSLLLHYPGISSHLVEEGFLSLLLTKVREEIMCQEVLETFLALLLEFFESTPQPLLINVVGNLLGDQYLTEFNRVKTAWKNVPAGKDVLSQAGACEKQVKKLQSAYVDTEKELRRASRSHSRSRSLSRKKDTLTGGGDSDGTLEFDFEVDFSTMSPNTASVFKRPAGNTPNASSAATIQPPHAQTSAIGTTSPRDVPQLKFGVDIGAMRIIHNRTVENMLKQIGV